MTINKTTLGEMIKVNPELMNEWCVVWSGFVQYADHINGFNYSAGVIFKTMTGDVVEGFKTKGEWRRVVPSKRVKALTRKSSDQSFGYKAKSVKVSELLKVIDDGWDRYSSNCVFNLGMSVA